MELQDVSVSGEALSLGGVSGDVSGCTRLTSCPSARSPSKVAPVVSDMQLMHERLGHQKGIDVTFLIDHDVVRGIKLRDTAKASCTKHDPCHQDNCLNCSRFVPKAKHVNSTREASPTAKHIGDVVSRRAARAAQNCQ